MARRYGAIVIEQESPWTQFLGGIGQGISRGVERFEQETDRKKQQALNVKEQILRGGDARPYTTLEGQAFLKAVGLDKDPDIMKIVETARATLPKEITEGAPTPVTIPSKANQELGGYAANIPGPQLTPSVKQVMDIMQNEEDQRRLAINEAERKVSLYNSIELQRSAEAIRTGRKKSLIDQFQEKSKDLDDIGWPKANRRYSIDSNNNVSVILSQPDISKLTALADKKAQAYATFEERAAAYNEKRLSHTYRLRSMLENDKILPQELGLGADEESRWYLAALAAIGSKQDTKEKVAATIDQVGKIIESVNKSITAYNRAIQAEGDKAGADQDTITSRFIQKLTFEDVSGGLTPEQYKERKNPTDPGKLIADIRGSYTKSGVSSPRPAVGAAMSDADKVRKVYDDLKGTIMEAIKTNPNVSGAQIRAVIEANKDQLMAEYGLNERLYSLLMAMADRVLG